MTRNAMSEFWISKYALSQGVFSVSAIECGDGMICVEGNKRTTVTHYYHGLDWHRTKLAANNKAEMARSAKISSLRKSIAKLEKMKFE